MFERNASRTLRVPRIPSDKASRARSSSTSRRAPSVSQSCSRRQRGGHRGLKAGEFFGEGCLVGQAVHAATASAMSECCVLRIRRQEIARKLHAEENFAECFVSHILRRNIRMEEDLVDQLFNSTEKRLARTLLLLAQYSNNDGPLRVLPKDSRSSSQRWSDHPSPGQLLHEQVQEAPIHRYRRGRCESQQHASRRRLVRLTEAAGPRQRSSTGGMSRASQCHCPKYPMCSALNARNVAAISSRLWTSLTDTITMM